MMTDRFPECFVVLGDQLFPSRFLTPYRHATFFMAETTELCTRIRHHQQKLVLVLSAMREYADELRRKGYTVVYDSLEHDPESTYEEKLAHHLSGMGTGRLVSFEIEDRFMEGRIGRFAESMGLGYEVLPTPMFICSRQSFTEYLAKSGQPRMASFYRYQRRTHKLLVDDHGRPVGGKWSFDTDNRRRFPVDIRFPGVPRYRNSKHVVSVQRVVRDRFSQHPGKADEFWLPVTRRQALKWLDDFLERRLMHFGDYEDALTDASDVAFHSVLSPLLNIGLLVPAEVLDRAIRAAESGSVSLNNIEGFVRQIAGWREFVRGIYRDFDDRQAQANHFEHTRPLTSSWYDGTTGILPLDNAIRKTVRLGWAHHIERLMVIGNLMTLCEIEPRAAHRWFMEMYVDSTDWVMGPNVYGMALHSDGGLFATKPYICGSNYLRRMGSYGRGDWCDLVDGLYWRFVDRHQRWLVANPRTRSVVATLTRMAPARKAHLLETADTFLETMSAIGSRRTGSGLKRPLPSNRSAGSTTKR